MSKYAMMKRLLSFSNRERPAILLFTALAVLGTFIVVERLVTSYQEERSSLTERFVRDEERSLQLAELHYREQFRAVVESHLDPDTLRASSAQARDFLNTVAGVGLRRAGHWLQSHGFTTIGIYGPDGRLLDYVGDPAANASVPVSYGEREPSGETHIPHTFVLSGGAPAIRYAYPVRADGVLFGTITGVVEYEQLLSVIERQHEQPYELLVPGADAAGDTDSWPPGNYHLVTTFEGAELTNERSQLREALGSEVAERLAEGGPGVANTTIDGTSYVAVLVPIDSAGTPNPPYIVFYETSRAFHSLFVNSAERITIGGVFIGGLLMIIVVILRARNRAIEASRTKSLFLANVSHELRTPMNGVLGMISALEAPDIPEEKRQEYIRLLRQSSDSLLHLLNSILDMSRLEAAKMEITRVPLDLHELVKDAVTQIKSSAVAQGLELRVDIQEDAPRYVQTDGHRIRQILTNCLHNALKFTDEGGVTLSLSAAGSQAHPAARFAVTDTGVGIEPDKLTTIFEKFTQVNVPAARRYGGSGLGLSIVKGLADLLGGSVEVESVPGVGTTFTVTIPVQQASREAVDEQQFADASTDQTLPENHKLHVLLAEDDQVNALVTSEILRKQGWSVEVARDGVEAVELGQDGSFDVILMDRQMPNMDGLEATRELTRLWAAGGVRATPILGLSAAISPEDQQGCVEAGMVGFLAKPVTAHSLIGAVSRNATAGPPIDLAVAESSFDTDTELLDEVLPIFLEQAQERVAEIKQGVAEHSAERIGRQTHPLKTAARYLGAHRLGSLAAEMDEMTTRADLLSWEAMATLQTQLIEELGRIEQWAKAGKRKSLA